MWSQDDVAAFWGWAQAPQREVIPIEERCWRCDGRRAHEGCAAGLCDPCCTELRKGSAA